ncbi:MAG: CBS domain-containing protein [Desulfobacteraceae bacterium]|nr:CBS domain-containing protein [Desulfobacteraceae bacterium]
MMKVKDLLTEGDLSFHELRGDETVEEAIKRMSAYSVSALVIRAENELHGIFTERDLIRCHILFPDRAVGEIPVKEVMTSRLIVAEPEDTIEEAMGMMIQARIRHLPVVSAGRITGMLGLEDLVGKHVGALTRELHYLKDYISDLQDAAHD